MRVALMSGPELVIFVGPPYSSKTLYYFQHYASTHERISARELFQNEATRGLRHVILALTDLLKQGKNVVLDDDNWSRETRTSYIRSVKKKVPSCNFMCICFEPAYGADQCYWSREWVSAQRSMDNWSTSSIVVNSLEASPRIEDWFRESSITSAQASINLYGPELPLLSEGFSVQNTVKTFLSSWECKQFVFPALFLQWEAIIQSHNKKVCLLSATTEAVKTWTQRNMTGRVIIIGDGKHQESMLSSLPVQEASLEMLQLISGLASQVSTWPYYWWYQI